MTTRLVLGLEERAAESVAVAGGKGGSLARLIAAGLPVPAGLVVTAAGYRAFVEGVPLSDATRGDLATLRRRLRGRPLPDPLERELRERVPALLARGAVAVRSSSTLEDLAGAAFAGQHDTFLQVVSMENVLAKVKACFASLWEDRAVRYREERGFGHSAAAMAVVIQTMVPAEIAGVAFCVHPVTGDLSQVVIDAAWGLGETVVSGEGEVDEIVAGKATGRVIERRIGAKSLRISAGREGTMAEPVPETDRERCCLDDERVAELVALANRVERLAGFPQDLEWAITAAGELRLLQARPVTRFPARWTRDESAERFPNVTTPLAWDFVSEGFHESLAASLAAMGLPAPAERWFERFEGYVYGNQTAVTLYARGDALAFSTWDEARSLMPRIRERYRLVQQLPVAWMRDLDHYLLELGRLGAVDLAGLPDAAAVWSHVSAIDALGREYFRPNIAISILQGQLHRALFRVAALAKGAAAAPALHDALTGFCETKTHLVNAELQELAARIRGDAALASVFASHGGRAIWEEGRLDAFPAFRGRFERFLRDHGHREVDWDVFVPPWSGQPWVVLETLALLAAAKPPAAREESLRVRQAAAEAELAAAVPEDLRFFAAELVRLARVYTALDDLEHYQTTRLSVPFRAALLELGRRFVDAGALGHPEEVFFLRKTTAAMLARGELGAAKVFAEARANRADWERWKTAPPRWSLDETAEPAAEGALRGIPGSPGIATGPVFRVHGPEDFARFPKGAILVARTTNPAWTPLFWSAAGVITESGGPLSHGAVTAREIGLPAVMAVRGAMSALPDGTIVRVNGTTGAVETT